MARQSSLSFYVCETLCMCVFVFLLSIWKIEKLLEWIIEKCFSGLFAVFLIENLNLFELARIKLVTFVLSASKLPAWPMEHLSLLPPALIPLLLFLRPPVSHPPPHPSLAQPSNFNEILQLTAFGIDRVFWRSIKFQPPRKRGRVGLLLQRLWILVDYDSGPFFFERKLLWSWNFSP